MSTEQNNCGKKDLLMAILYNEANATERKDFESHQLQCADCRLELQTFKHTRAEISSWQIPFTPAINVTIPRTAMDALREFFTLVPTWFKIGSGLATVTAAALLFFAIAKMNPAPAIQQAENKQSQPVEKIVVSQNSFTREEAEKMIQSAVAKAQQQSQLETKMQLATLESKLNVAHQSDMKNATLQLKKQQQKSLNALVADSQKQTVAEWLFASTDTGVDDEKNN
jgi:hypothetical protein